MGLITMFTGGEPEDTLTDSHHQWFKAKYHHPRWWCLIEHAQPTMMSVPLLMTHIAHDCLWHCQCQSKSSMLKPCSFACLRLQRMLVWPLSSRHLLEQLQSSASSRDSLRHNVPLSCHHSDLKYNSSLLSTPPPPIIWAILGTDFTKASTAVRVERRLKFIELS